MLLQQHSDFEISAAPATPATSASSPSVSPTTHVSFTVAPPRGVELKHMTDVLPLTFTPAMAMVVMVSSNTDFAMNLHDMILTCESEQLSMV